MLLKYRSNCLKDMFKKAIVFSVCTLYATSALSENLGNESLQVHGFIAQGVIDVNGTDFVNDDGNISAHLTELGVNGSYRVNEWLRLTGQVVYLDGGNRYVKGARVDYALLDFSVFQDENWLVNLYLGRYKNNNWLYSSTRDVPHARPSIILPQSIYFDGFRDIAMGSDGAALKISYSSESLGDFDINVNYGSSSLDTKDAKLLLGDYILGKGEQEFDAQFSLYWQPVFSSWQFGISLLDSDFNYRHDQADLFTDALFSFQQYTVNALYEGEQWEFSVEAFQQKFLQKGFYFDGFSYQRTGQGAYLQSKYKYDARLSFLARFERFYADKNDKNGSKLSALSGGVVPSYFGYQNDVTIGASYDISQRLRAQIEYHQIEGTARLTPIVMPNVQVNDREKWNIVAVQLMYWF